MQNQFRGVFIGLLTIDLQFLTNQYPPANSKIKAKEFLIATGGPATNAAVTFSVLNDGADLITSIGKNQFSVMINDDLEKYGLRVRDLSAGEDRMPIFAAAVTASDTGERTIFSYHPPVLPPDKDLPEPGDAPDILLCDGFYLSSTMHLLDRWQNQEMVTVFDGGSWKEGTERILPKMKVIICSENFNPPGCKNQQDVVEYLKSIPAVNWAITRGERSILYGDGDKVAEIEVPKVKPIDTLGAGDVFHGSFCYHFLRLKDFKQALIEASEDAAHSCQYLGARKWLEV